MGKYAYFKMANKDASIFFDSKSGLMVTQQEPGKVLAISYQTSRKVKEAVKNSFIKEITEEEYNKIINPSSKTEGIQEQTPKANDGGFSNLNKDELYTYLKDNYEVDKDELEAFKKMSKKEMIAYLEDLEKGDDGDEDGDEE